MGTPFQEYCFLWIDHWSTCMSKAEWSGWMQAIGAVLALFIAIWISGHQRRVDKRNAVLQARITAKGVVLCVQAMAYGLQSGVRGLVRTSSINMNEYFLFSQKTSPELLPEGAMQNFLDMRMNVAIILHMVENFEKDPNQLNALELSASLKYYASLLGPSAEFLHKRHGGVSSEKYSAKEQADKFVKNANAMSMN